MISPSKHVLPLMIFLITLLNSSVITFDSQLKIQNTNLKGAVNDNGKDNWKKDKDMTFQDFKSTLGKRYSTQNQQNVRKQAFQKNMKKLKQTSCSPCGVTSFMDKTDQQIQKLTGGYRSDLFNPGNSQRLLQSVNTTLPSIPSSLFWTNYNVVTPVKNQDACGACYAFAVAGMFQSQLVRRNISSNSIDLSEQFLLQCDSGSKKCLGGNPASTINLGLMYDIPLQSTFPYRQTNFYDTICGTTNSPLISNYKFPLTSLSYYVNSGAKISQNNLIGFILQRPVVIAVYGNDLMWYKPNGEPFRCGLGNSLSFTKLNHAVLLTGYNQTVWQIKNSWGTGYGERGYVYVTRDILYDCGIGYAVFSLNSTLPGVK